MKIPRQAFDEIDRLRELNLNLQAYEQSKAFGDLSQWEGTDELILASHLAFNLGAPDTSWRLSSRAWHRDKSHPKATFYFAAEVLHRRGPLPALIFMRRFPDFRVADEVLMSWWFSLYSQLHAMLRDFALAGRWHREAVAACPDESWVWVTRAYSLEQQDLYEEALATAQKAFELGPSRRGAVAAVVHYLTLLERNHEALGLLSDRIENVENPWMVKDLADLQSELGLHEEAYATLHRCFRLMPLLEKKAAEWFYGGLSDGAYLVGDLDRAKEYAEKAANPFHTKVLENLKSPPPNPRRVLLDVRFLRQHDVTCAPATLSNIGRYWKKKAEHLELVEQMCYDGTPSYKERIWAESNGWITREFTLNWHDATALLERGVPLTLATVHPGGGHLQAIIGYDAMRRTYLVRDPYYQRTGEFLADELVEAQKANGPRVMALVPVEARHLLEGLERPLFETEIYDLLYGVESELEVHKRTEAGAALRELEEKYPDHRLTYAARWAISTYDSNGPGIRTALKHLLEKFPDDINLRLSDISVSAEWTGRVERIQTLENYSRSKPTDPLIWQMLGYELGVDAKQHSRALHWLAKSIRKIPTNAINYRLAADILWSQRRFAESTELYRFASSLNDKDEHLAYSYFLAMRHLRREDEVIDVLADRVKRFGKQSSLPVRSLFSALRELGRVDEAFEALESAIKLRPDDGGLILFTAEARARYGRSSEADELLRFATDKAPISQWLRTAANISHLKGELANALSLWRKVIEEDPTAVDAQDNVAFLIKALEGTAAAKDHLRRACRKFPRNRSLHVLRLQHLNEEPAEAIAVLRDLVRMDPGDVWSLRELSKWYCHVGKFDRALEVAEQAVAVDPGDAVSHWFRGRALELLKRNIEAADEYRSAISLDVDNTSSITSLLAISHSLEEKRNVLGFVWSELNRQFSAGNGLFAYREEARRLMDRPTLLKNLREFAAANRQSWFAASAVIQQLAEMGEIEQAREMALESTRRFPLFHNTWLDLSFVHKLVGNVEGEIEALRMAISINPIWSYGVQQLAATYQRAGRQHEARDLLVDALTRMPFDNYLLGYLADVYWELGERETAIQTARKAVTIEPDYTWAWAAIKRWAAQTGDEELPVVLARELAEKKPKDVQAWITLADMLDTGTYSEELMMAVERALKIDPYSPSALATKANALADARRFDEAIEIAQTKMPDGYRPEQLRFVEAGIEAARGNMRRSMDVLIELTETSPGYLPGWLRLADIYRSGPDWKHEYRKAAMEITRLAPSEPTGFGYLAEACLNLDLEEGAREALEQSVILDPTYEYGVTRLFDLYLDRGDDQSADRLVETVLTSSPATGLPLAVESAVKKGDKPEVLRRLVLMLQNHEIVSERLDRVFEKISDLFGKKDKSLLEALREVCSNENPNPIAGRYLIDQVWEIEKKAGCEKTLESISDKPPLWAFAASRFMEKLADSKPAQLRKFIDANAEKLATNTESWGAVGYQLTNLQDTDRMMKWFDGWQNRQDVLPWMLWNYSIQLRRGGYAWEAEKVNSAALELQYDDTVSLHLTMLGLVEFNKGNFAGAAAMSSQINPSTITEWDRLFYDTLNEARWAVECIQSADIEGAKALVDSIVQRMISADPKQRDQIIKDMLGGALEILLDLIGSKWYTFRKKAQLLYYSLG